ncbi:hypothetical protein KW429_17280 [Vibrio fluvialis]|nr:hypothetical protein [Vibrio fluvialis]
MKVAYIESVDLPNIAPSVKECINSGQWFLFKAPEQANPSSEVAYYLKANKEFYALDKQGNLLECELPVEFNTEELIYFIDLPTPQSLSNQFTLVA